MSEQPARPYIGGQAVIEGVMMRSPSSLAIVCRRRSGELMVREQPLAATPKGPRTWPFVRGVATVVESLRLGSQALRWSAELYEKDLDDGADQDGAQGKPPGTSGTTTALALSMAALATQEADGAAPAKKGAL